MTKNFVVPLRAPLGRFLEVVSLIQRRVIGTVREFGTLAAIRDALLPKLISGEIRISEATPIEMV